MTYTIYDKETNEYFAGTYGDLEIVEVLENITDTEPDRAQFYEFEDERGEKYSYWDLCLKYGIIPF